MAPKQIAGVRVVVVSRSVIDAGAGKAGLWSDGPNSFFHNSRVVRALDPSEEERDLIKDKRYWYTKLDQTTSIKRRKV